MDGRTLSDADIEAISEAVAVRLPVCSLGLSPEDATIIKNHLGLYKRACSIIGNVILTAIALVLVAVVTKGIWASLIEGVKK